MPAKSSIRTLPPEILAEVNRIVGEDKWTLDELVAYLRQAGHPRSRSALGRYKQQLDKVAERMRRSREITDALMREIGPGMTDGKTVRMLVEILQSLAFDFLLNQSDEKDADALDSRDFMHLGRMLKDMAASMKIDTDRELKLREAWAAEAAKKLDEAAEESEQAGEPGLTRERIEQLKREFLGVGAAA